MSVLVMVELPGTQAEKFLEVYGRHAARLDETAGGRSAGALHHMFVANENGTVLVVDEWTSREAFEAFAATSDEIRAVLAEVGLSAPPVTTAYRVLETSDRF
ncbi:MAG: hypothetical protein EKK42_02295 [Pseudonocardiaceae bacterium]|nr:MAG: hypothetical protein EKK42_02295 [Pseudonocardiaceae bacterium]